MRRNPSTRKYALRILKLSWISLLVFVILLLSNSWSGRVIVADVSYAGLEGQAVNIVGECARFLVYGNIFADLGMGMPGKPSAFDVDLAGAVSVSDNVVAEGFEVKPEKLKENISMPDKTWIGHYACWGVPWVGKKHDSDTEYIALFFRYPTYDPIPEDLDEDLYYAIYDTSLERWTVTDKELADHSQDNRTKEAHPTWGYFGGEYHVFYNQTHNDVDDIAEIKSPSWEGFGRYVLSDNEYSPTGDIGGRFHHAVLVRSPDREAWLLYSFLEGEDRYLGYTVWTKENGWDEKRHKIETSKNRTGSITALEHNGTIYVYSANDANKTVYCVMSLDNGATWNDSIDTGVYAPITSRATVHLNTENEFVMVYDDMDGVAVRKSADGIKFGEKTVVCPKAYTSHFAFIEGTDKAIIVHPDMESHGKTWDIYGSIVDTNVLRESE